MFNIKRYREHDALQQQTDLHDSQSTKRRRLEKLMLGILHRKKKNNLQAEGRVAFSNKDKHSLMQTLQQLQPTNSTTAVQQNDTTGVQSTHNAVPVSTFNNTLMMEQTGSLERDCKEYGISSTIVNNLKHNLNITSLFAIQKKVIEKILDSDSSSIEYDIGICAPTGSGKTLSYVIPVVHKLLLNSDTKYSNKVTRALIILPTKELVEQVFKVVQKCIKATTLTSLLLKPNRVFYSAPQHQQESKDAAPFSIATERTERELNKLNRHDIVVATPNTLLTYLQLTSQSSHAGLSTEAILELSQLEYIVFDEADRLVSPSTQAVMTQIYQNVYRQSSKKRGERAVNQPSLLSSFRIPYEPTTANLEWNMFHRPLRKIFCSATLTMNPQKLGVLKLVRPVFITHNSFYRKIERKESLSEEVTVSGDIFSPSEKEEEGSQKVFKYVLPATVSNFLVLSSRRDRNAALLYLLAEKLEGQKTLIFTNSAKSTAWLYRFIKQYFKSIDKEQSASVATISSLATGRKKAIQLPTSTLIKRFNQGRVNILISTDLTARGIDLPGLQNVVNYDLPVYAKTIVHRAGRTGRAGQRGTCYFLVHPEEQSEMLELLSQVGSSAATLSLVDSEAEMLQPIRDQLPRSKEKEEKE